MKLHRFTKQCPLSYFARLVYSYLSAREGATARRIRFALRLGSVNVNNALQELVLLNLVDNENITKPLPEGWSMEGYIFVRIPLRHAKLNSLQNLVYWILVATRKKVTYAYLSKVTNVNKRRISNSIRQLIKKDMLQIKWEGNFFITKILPLPEGWYPAKKSKEEKLPEMVARYQEIYHTIYRDLRDIGLAENKALNVVFWLNNPRNLLADHNVLTMPDYRRLENVARQNAKGATYGNYLYKCILQEIAKKENQSKKWIDKHLYGS